MFYNQLLTDFHCAQQFQIYEDNAPFRAPWILCWEQPASSISFSFCSRRIAYRYWPEHSVQWLDTNCKLTAAHECLCSILCRGKIPSAALPATWQTSAWMYEVGKFNQSLLAGAFLGIMLGPAIAYQKSASDCSLERYRKLGSLSGTVRAEAFQWNHKWYGYWAKQRQAVKTYARTVLLSACWLYCASFAKLKKCLEQAWNRKDKP